MLVDRPPPEVPVWTGPDDGGQCLLGRTSHVRQAVSAVENISLTFLPLLLLIFLAGGHLPNLSDRQGHRLQGKYPPERHTQVSNLSSITHIPASL